MTDLLVDRRGRALWLTINREDKRNALSRAVLAGLLDGVRAAADDGALTVVVITSAGEKVFSAGAGLAVMSNDATGLEQHGARGLLKELVVAIRGCPNAVIARGQGLCLAGRLGLAARC